MLFNSLSFAIFLPIVFLLYWFATNGKLRLQNIFLLVSSYYFYACWDWRFMFLLIFSTFLDYYTGIKIHEASIRKKKLFWLWLSIGINLGFLGVFKYYNFFTESFASGLSLFGLKSNLSTLQVILPVGISFYTFHGLSYVLDIYKNRIHPERNFVDYSVFVSFFPLLVAGPIERATHLLPQILKKREFDYSLGVDGLRQILWGLFKKIVIADNCATYVNLIFDNYTDYNGSTLLLAAVLFAFQIYGDFSGYSDIAIGTGKLFGIHLIRNFNLPYFSRDIAEFWRRWHISLSSWFRDYLYIPLGGSRAGKWSSVRNTLIIFLVSGFWHGANWTFVIWGLYHGLLFLPLLLLGRNRQHTNIVAQNSILPNIKEFFQVSLTFILVVIGWVFFRAENVHTAFGFISKILSDDLFQMPVYEVGLFKTIFFTGVLLLVEWFNRLKLHAFDISTIKSSYIRKIIYYTVIAVILEFGANSQSFIYFQF